MYGAEACLQMAIEKTCDIFSIPGIPFMRLLKHKMHVYIHSIYLGFSWVSGLDKLVPQANQRFRVEKKV